MGEQLRRARHALRSLKHCISCRGPAWHENIQTLDWGRKTGSILPQTHKNGQEWEPEGPGALQVGPEAVTAPVAWGCYRDSWACPGRVSAHQSPAPSASWPGVCVVCGNRGRRCHFGAGAGEGGPALSLWRRAAAWRQAVRQVSDGAVLQWWKPWIAGLQNVPACLLTGDSWSQSPELSCPVCHSVGRGAGGKGKTAKTSPVSSWAGRGWESACVFIY